MRIASYWPKHKCVSVGGPDPLSVHHSQSLQWQSDEAGAVVDAVGAVDTTAVHASIAWTCHCSQEQERGNDSVCSVLRKYWMSHSKCTKLSCECIKHILST